VLHCAYYFRHEFHCHESTGRAHDNRRGWGDLSFSSSIHASIARPRFCYVGTFRRVCGPRAMRNRTTILCAKTRCGCEWSSRLKTRFFGVVIGRFTASVHQSSIKFVRLSTPAGHVCLPRREMDNDKVRGSQRSPEHKKFVQSQSAVAKNKSFSAVSLSISASV
jgi:hypothetical protein